MMCLSEVFTAAPKVMSFYIIIFFYEHLHSRLRDFAKSMMKAATKGEGR